MLLLRPHAAQVETVNDADSMVANFWRATQQDPDGVAEYADGPVNETDMHARHRWLVLSDDAGKFRRRMRRDPDYYDVKVAGWWVWGMGCWIGSGWCDASRLKRGQKSRMHLSHPNGEGVHKKSSGPMEQIPKLSGYGGVHRKRGEPGGQIPALSVSMGVHKGGGRPQLADAYSRGRGVHGNDAASTCDSRREWLAKWFRQLRDRLCTVRVCCGDWKRICDSDSTLTRLGVTGVFLDPPYSDEADRCKTIYAVESGTVAHDVRRWCLKYGDVRKMRIALCGYEGEGHEALEKKGWSVMAWKSQGGYGGRSDKGKSNAKRERIWFSPHCKKPSQGFGL